MNEDIRVAKDQLVQDVRAVISEAEQVMRSAANDGSERARRVRDELEVRLQGVRDQLRRIEGVTVERARAVAKTADTYVHDKPWQAIAVVAVAGAVIGLMAAMAFSGEDE